VEFVVDKVSLGQVFSEYFGFPCQFSFYRLFDIHHYLSSGAGTIGQLVADVPIGLSLTPPQEAKKKNLTKLWQRKSENRVLHKKCMHIAICNSVSCNIRKQLDIMTYKSKALQINSVGNIYLTNGWKHLVYTVVRRLLVNTC
jgi:hypothetical protein